MIDIEKLKQAALAAEAQFMFPSYFIGPEAVLELITRLEAAEKDTARIRFLTSMDDDDFLDFMSSSDMMPEQFTKLVDKAMGKRPQEYDYASEVTYARAVEDYCNGQSAQIEILRDALEYYANSNHDEFQNTARKALATPTNSSQVLQEWLDAKLGEPVTYVDRDTLIHRANGEFASFGDPLFKKPEAK